MHANLRVRYFQWLKQVILTHVDEASRTPVLVHQMPFVCKHLGECNVHLLFGMSKSNQMLQQRASFVKMPLLEQLSNALNDAVRVHDNERFRIRVFIDLEAAAVAVDALVLAGLLIIAHK